MTVNAEYTTGVAVVKEKKKKHSFRAARLRTHFDRVFDGLQGLLPLIQLALTKSTERQLARVNVQLHHRTFEHVFVEQQCDK